MLNDRAVLCVMWDDDDTLSEFTSLHSDVHAHVGAPLRIVGAIAELDVVAVAARLDDADGERVGAPNDDARRRRLPDDFERPVRGRVAFVRTVGDEAVPCDVRASEIRASLAVLPHDRLSLSPELR